MNATLIAYGLIAAISLGTGWAVRGWKENSETLAIERAVQKVADDAVARESGIAEQVEARLAELTANKTVIDRGVIREIEKPIYRNVCLPGESIRLLNSAARGEAPADPAEPADEMPAEPVPAN